MGNEKISQYRVANDSSALANVWLTVERFRKGGDSVLFGVKRGKFSFVILIGIVAIILLRMFILAHSESIATNKINYVPLLDGGNSKVLDKAEHRLDQLKINFKIVGAILEVQAEQVNKARIELAEIGLPKRAQIKTITTK